MSTDKKDYGKMVFKEIKNNNTPTEFAYVLCVFNNPQYMLGAVTTAYSIKCTSPKYNIVCLVTPDIPKSWVDLGIPIFDYILEVPYLTGYTLNMKTKKQQTMYESWKDMSFTKWNCIGLDYKKVLLVDADKIVLHNIDHLFDLNCPAGTFSSPFAQGYAKGIGGIKNPYLKFHHGEIVKNELVHKGLQESFVVIGTCILLKPEAEKFQNMKNFIAKYTEENPFGFPNCNSMIDEQFICNFENTDLTYISQKYNWIPWHPQWLRQQEFPPSVIHFFSTKPWVMKRQEWLDMEIWWDFVSEMIKHIFKNSQEVIKLFREDQYKLQIQGCPYCKILNRKYRDHNFIKNGKIVCSNF
jgi:lipopolysaccharide biosynthesis glycosyltransferase